VQGLQRDLELAQGRIAELESDLAGVGRIVKAISGSEDLNDLINLLLDLHRILIMVTAAMTAFQAARMAAGDPLAWLGFFVSAGTLAVGVGQMMEIRRPRY